MTPSQGIEPGTHWWEASALNTTPPLDIPPNGKKTTENLVIFINTESVKQSMEEQCAFKSPLVCSLEADTSLFADEYIFQAGTVAVISWVIIH